MEKAAQDGVKGMRMDYLFAECLGYAECRISWAQPVPIHDKMQCPDPGCLMIPAN
jgi:hypothetical protein